MLFLGVPAGYYEYLAILGIFIAVSVILFITGIYYLKKTKRITKGSLIPAVFGASLVLIPIISYIASMFVRSPGYSMVMNNVVLLGGILILVAVFIICVYLIKSKEKIKLEVEREREDSVT